MAPQPVADIVPRVRRALEGVRTLPNDDPTRLSDSDIEAAAADAIADLILYTGGAWAHTIEILAHDDQTGVDTFGVTPGLSFEEQGLVAIQAALNHFFHVFRGQKISERIVQEGRTWEWSQSANVMRDAIKLLKDQRDLALQSLQATVPAFARAVSYLSMRDPLSAIYIDADFGGVGAGGQAVLPPGFQG